MQKYRLNPMIPYLAIGISLMIIYAMLWQLTPQRVGDGSEYYALFYAWHDTLRPWMTDISFNSYELLRSKLEISGLVPREWLESAFPALRLSDSADFNHFWFYSFLAFLVSKFLEIFRIDLGVHESFLALHFLLLFITAIASYHLFKWKGLAAFIIITFTSPMVWFFDKVHTELFTYSTVFLSVLFILRKRYMFGAFALALASTQNISFALIAFVPYAYRIIILRDTKFTFTETIFAIATALTVLAHPVYYFLRFGVPSPQLLAGGGSAGANLSYFYIWLADPDIGLFPNWPVGVIFLLLAVGFWARSVVKLGIPKPDFFSLFVFVFFTVNLYAQSSTENINSGATPGVARYALWYLPIFFPMIYQMLSLFTKKLSRALGGIFLTIFAILNITENNPARGESYNIPTKLSYLIQKYASNLYNPHPEIFAERYSGYGEGIYSLNPGGIVGPDCRKVLVYPSGEKGSLIVPPDCFLDGDKIAQQIATFESDGQRRAFYIILPESKLEDSQLVVPQGSFLSFGVGKMGNVYLRDGWSTPENWGIWSDSRIATISFPCNAKQFYFNKESIVVNLKLQPFGKQNITVENDGAVVYEGTLDTAKTISFTGAVGYCKQYAIDFKIRISDPKSPFELGQSDDNRKLGVGIINMFLDSDP